MDIGFKNAGFDVVWANDINKDACETHRRWSGSEVVCADIAEFGPDKMPSCDVIVGGFPCQGFSLAGNRDVNDDRNLMYRHFVRCVGAKKPLAFVAENVQGLMTIGGSNKVAQRILTSFMEQGYSVNSRVINASRVGVPQERKRLIIIGIRNDLETMPEFPDEDDEVATMRQALWGLGAPDRCDVFCGSFSSQFMSRNRWRGWDEPSFTVIAKPDKAPLHPSSPPMIQVSKDEWRFGDGETRRMSWRETALIQTFPSDLEFAGGLASKYKQVGNAVPCKLAEAVARRLLATLRG